MKLNIFDVHRLTPEVKERVFASVHKKIKSQTYIDVCLKVWSKVGIQTESNIQLQIVTGIYSL